MSAVASHPAASQQHHLRQRPAQRREQLQVHADAAPHPADIQQDERARPGLDRRPRQHQRVDRPRFRPQFRSREGQVVPEVQAERHLGLRGQPGQVGERGQGLEPDDDVTECAAEALELGERGDAGIEQQRTAEALAPTEAGCSSSSCGGCAADGIEVGHVAALHRGQRAIRPRQGHGIAIDGPA